MWLWLPCTYFAKFILTELENTDPHIRNGKVVVLEKPKGRI